MFCQTMLKKVGKTGLALSALLGLGGLGASHVSAASIPSISTLQDLINTGANGVVIGDKRFYNFSYIGSPTSGPNPAPTASQISVAQSALPGGNIGLSFSYAWLSAEGFNQDSVIQYCVQVVPGTTGAAGNLIDGVLLNFNGTAPVPGTLTNATVTETVQDLNGTTLGQLSTFDDGPGGQTNTDQTKLMLAPPLGGICVTKDIQVHSTGATGGGVSTISIVDNTFHQVPEPASLGLIALGLPLLARRRRA